MLRGEIVFSDCTFQFSSFRQNVWMSMSQSWFCRPKRSRCRCLLLLFQMSFHDLSTASHVTTGERGGGKSNPLQFTPEPGNRLISGSARFGALSHHSFFSRHNPHPHRVRHIQGNQPGSTCKYSFVVPSIAVINVIHKCYWDVSMCIMPLPTPTCIQDTKEGINRLVENDCNVCSRIDSAKLPTDKRLDVCFGMLAH